MIHSGKKIWFRVLPAVLLILSLTGCGAKSKKTASYDFSRVSSTLASHDLKTVDGFARKHGLCVLGADEHGIYEQEHLDYICGIFDLNNQKTLYAQRIFEQIEPASLTKIMTAYLALKYGNLDDVIVVSDIINLITDPGASTCNLEVGDTMTLKQLLYAFLVHSGNDAGNVIAEYISGSIEAFADLMNEEAQSMGATHTHFKNPHGLSDPEHYTTAYDLYLIFNEAIKNETFLELISTATYECTYTTATGESKTQTFNNTNRFLHNEYKPPAGVRVLGGKTGSTDEAGLCLICLCYDESNNPYISIVMHATSRIQLYQAHIMLMYLI